MSFHVGQKVVCINDDFSNVVWNDEVRPTKGHVYTIRAVDVIGDRIGVFLSEIRNKPRQYSDEFGECSFNASRFRPVVTRKTSIEVFQRILDNPRLPIREDA